GQSEQHFAAPLNRAERLSFLPSVDRDSAAVHAQPRPIMLDRRARPLAGELLQHLDQFRLARRAQTLRREEFTQRLVRIDLGGGEMTGRARPRLAPAWIALGQG